jgi:molybdopterin converting factor subunit 1
MVYHPWMVRIEVLCFAAARDATGVPTVRLELGTGATVEATIASLVERHPGLRRLVPALRYAVNEEFVPVTQELRDGDVLALIPPVSGG